MRPNVIKILSAFAAALVLGITGFLNLNQGSSQALTLPILGDINIGGVGVDVCRFTSIDSIVSFVNANNGTTSDVTSSDVLSSLGGSLSDYRLANCGSSSTNPNQHIYGSCNEYWANGLYGVRRGSSNYNSRLDTLGTGVICNRNKTPKVKVTGNADCTVSQKNDTTYGNRLNDAIDEYNTLVTNSTLSSSDGGTTVTTAEQNEIDIARVRVTDLRDSYNGNLGVLKVDCNQNQSNVTINNQLPASGGTTVVVPAPSSGSSYTVPRKYAETGDGSTVVNVG